MRTPPVPALIALGTLAAAAVILALLVAGPEPEPIAADPTPTPPATEPTPDPEPEPTPEPTPEPPPEAEPFEVRLAEEDGLLVITTDNAPVLSVPSLETDGEVAGRAAEIARAAVEDFLNAQFTDRETWFGAAPIEALLTPRAMAALSGEDRAALGDLDLDVDHVETGQAEADAMVTMHGERPRNVTLDFSASLTAVAGDGRQTPLVLRGSFLFLPTEDGWLVEAVDATLTGEAGA